MHFTDTMRSLTKKSEVRMGVPNWRKVVADGLVCLILGHLVLGLHDDWIVYVKLECLLRCHVR